MRKAVKGLAGLTSFLLVLAGLITCMCDTADWDKQLMLLCTGTGMVIIGVVLGELAKGGKRHVEIDYLSD